MCIRDRVPTPPKYQGARANDGSKSGTHHHDGVFASSRFACFQGLQTTISSHKPPSIFNFVKNVKISLKFIHFLDSLHQACYHHAQPSFKNNQIDQYCIALDSLANQHIYDYTFVLKQVRVWITQYEHCEAAEHQWRCRIVLLKMPTLRSRCALYFHSETAVCCLKFFSASVEVGSDNNSSRRYGACLLYTSRCV